jgi:3-hydroxybutyryl-CoA dehydratase
MASGKLTRSTGLYFDEFIPGDQTTSAGRTITETDVVNFAALSGDWNLIHTNAEYSKEHMFGQRVAHGLLILSIASGLAVRLGFMEETILAFRSVDDWRFQRPVFIGDTVRVRLTVDETKAMPRLGGGLVTFKVDVLNQEDKVVQRGAWEMLVQARED